MFLRCLEVPQWHRPGLTYLLTLQCPALGKQEFKQYLLNKCPSFQGTIQNTARGQRSLTSDSSPCFCVHARRRWTCWGAPVLNMLSSPVTCESGTFPRLTKKKECPSCKGVLAGLVWKPTQAWGAEETLRGLTSPGKTTVRQETHRQGWPALEIRTRALLAPHPLGATSQHNENPR